VCDRRHYLKAQLVWLAIALAIPASIVNVAAVAEENTATTDVSSIFSGSIPEDASDLRAMQARQQELAKKVIPATVAVQVGPAQGSGVIISPDGYVLTAAHVAGNPGRRATLILHNGRRVEGKTLGVFRTLDAGLIKITGDSAGDGAKPWPHAPMGKSDDLKPGQWCLATGHPGGFQTARTVVVRVGRILSINPDLAITTDCTLIGGDSGGPLFDMQGQVIGIHSRIGGPLTLNLHVPVHTYQQTWDRLAAGEAWGRAPGSKSYIGVQGDPESDLAKITEVYPRTPAAKAGVQAGDIITKFAGKKITTFQSLKSCVEAEEPEARVELEVLRHGKRIRLMLVVGRRQD
jgi:S1-C subfamily serine protease